jgi:flagellar motor protein MotB
MGDDEAKSNKDAPAAKTAARKEEAGDFPSLSSVPERPAVTPENQRALAAKGLAADQSRTNYSDEEIRRDSGSASARPGGVSATAPAPVAQVAVPAQAGAAQTPVAMPAPQRPSNVQPSGMPAGQPASAQSVFQQRINEQNANKLTPEMMMQGFFTGEAPQQPALRAPAAPGAMSAAPASSGGMLGHSAAATIPFEPGSELITPSAQSQLRQVAQLAAAQGKRLRIVGHSSGRMTDSSATGGDISKARAEAVARAIIGLGVPPGQVAVSALADTQPVSNVEAANRRVEIFVE